jgi:hypothetical protein
MPAEPSSPEEMLTAAEAAKILKVSESWLAKARMRAEGPPGFWKAGGCFVVWLKR